MESGEPLERVCELCDSAYCLGTFIHEFIKSEISNESWSNYNSNNIIMPMPDSDINNTDAGTSSEPPKDDVQLPSPKRGLFYSAIDEELSVAAAGIVPKNTESNNRWALNYFEAWREHYNSLHQDTPCRGDIPLTDDASELDYWLSRFMFKTRKEDGSPFPSRSIKLILSGLQQHMRAKSPSLFNIFHFEILGRLVIPFSKNYLPMELEHL